MGRHLKYPIKFFSHKIQEKLYFSFYDHNGHLLYPPSDYLIDLADNLGSSNSTIENRASTLKVFFIYLSERNIDYLQVNDEVLEAFRDSQLTIKNPNAQNNNNTRKRTINVYLRRIYDFYRWVQEQNPLKRILGTDGHQIYSTLLKSRDDKDNSLNYPKCFQRVGEHSKHTVNFVPTHDNYAELFDYFLNSRPDVAARNTLILKIFRETGLRVGSIASLTIDQFDESDVNKSVGNFIVRPAVQKFGYSKQFEVPLTLSFQIINYIKNERKLIANKFGSQSNIIFLSTTSGKPFESRPISQLFNRAARGLGWNSTGVGPHCWRRLFACETIESDIDSSLELGLDTSIEGISLRTAQKLGHNSIASQGAYIRDIKRRTQGSSVHKLTDELTAERDKNDRFATDIAELKRKLDMVERSYQR